MTLYDILTSPTLYLIAMILIIVPYNFSNVFVWLHRMFCLHFSTFVIRRYQRDLHDIKGKLFQQMQDMTSGDEDLQQQGLLRVLEIGVGPGANFVFYHPNHRLVLVDPNQHFKDYMNEHKNKFPNLNIEKIIIGEGEQLTEVKDQSVDVVVTSSVLCSCKDRETLLNEVKRVLHRGGKYLFVEHVAGNKGSLYYYVQTYVNPYIRFCGCELTKDHQSILEKAGFSSLDLKRIIAPLNFYTKPFMGPHLIGTAVK